MTHYPKAKNEQHEWSNAKTIAFGLLQKRYCMDCGKLQTRSRSIPIAGETGDWGEWEDAGYVPQ